MDVWLNGRLVPAAEATISVFDRGFLFGDGVYELVRYFNGVGLDLRGHVHRLRRSLAHIGIRAFNADDLAMIGQRLVRASGLEDAAVYLQVTRGAGADRRHVPSPDLVPTVFACITEAPPLSAMVGPEELRGRTLEDCRWTLCHIKCTSLLGNILSIMNASAQGADEAILHRHGLVAEGSHTNVFVVKDGVLATPAIDEQPPILHGVTREMVVRVARDCGVTVEMRPVTLAELQAADEVFITSTRKIIAAITQLDDHSVGSGVAGPLTRSLYDAARRRIAGVCGVNREAPATVGVSS